MLIFLIVILTIIQIALRISLIGIELSYRVNKRFIDLTTQAEKISSKVINKGVDLIDTKERSKDSIKTAVNTGTSVLMIVNGVAKRVGGVAKKASKVVVKWVIRILDLVIEIVRDALAAVSIYVIVIDVIVFLVIVAIASYYVLYTLS